MGRKDKSFSAKLGVNKEDQKNHCNKCGETFNYVQVINSIKDNNEVWKFKERYVSVCKCNQNEVYG